MRTSLMVAAALFGASAPAAAATAWDEAGPSRSALCRRAAAEAAARHAVPMRLLQAIALVESGRIRGGRRAPWPWTLNIDGQGVWAASRAEARARAEAALARGTRSIDLGCFQLNHRWHGHAFDSVDAMLDPMLGADYAARFLARLKAETGDWRHAAGYYHSRTPRHFRRYTALIDRTLARLASAPPREVAGAGPRGDVGPRRPAPTPAGHGGTGGGAPGTIRFARLEEGGASVALVGRASRSLLAGSAGPLIPGFR